MIGGEDLGVLEYNLDRYCDNFWGIEVILDQSHQNTAVLRRLYKLLCNCAHKNAAVLRYVGASVITSAYQPFAATVK